MLYQHTQTGTVIIVSLSAALVLTCTLGFIVAQHTASPILQAALPANLIILTIALLIFSRLTVSVTPTTVACQFNFGVLRRTFEIAAIDTVECVRNPWYYGWGIRYTPQGWLYNVSGLDAVQLRLASGKRFRIGTDEPQQLKAAIESAIAQNV